MGTRNMMFSWRDKKNIKRHYVDAPSYLELCTVLMSYWNRQCRIRSNFDPHSLIRTFSVYKYTVFTQMVHLNSLHVPYSEI